MAAHAHPFYLQIVGTRSGKSRVQGQLKVTVLALATGSMTFWKQRPHRRGGCCLYRVCHPGLSWARQELLWRLEWPVGEQDSLVAFAIAWSGLDQTWEAGYYESTKQEHLIQYHASEAAIGVHKRPEGKQKEQPA